jgi:hypothetical protein
MAIQMNTLMVLSIERGDLQGGLQLPTGSVYTALKGRHGSNSVGHYVWATHVLLSNLCSVGAGWTK